MAKRLSKKTKSIIRNLKSPSGVPVRRGGCKTGGNTPDDIYLGVDKASGPDESVERVLMPMDEFDRLKKRQVFCVWCGHTIAYDDGKTTAERYEKIIDSIKRHDMQCEKNPLKKLIDAYRKKRIVDGLNGRTWDAHEHLVAEKLIEELEKDFETKAGE